MKEDKIIIITILSLFVLLIAFIGLGIYGTILSYGNQTITREQILDANMEIINSDKGINRKKYVFTEQNTYEVEDRVFVGFVNSMDIYRIATMNIGKTCDITTIGHRVGFFSLYKTIININNCK